MDYYVPKTVDEYIEIFLKRKKLFSEVFLVSRFWKSSNNRKMLLLLSLPLTRDAQNACCLIKRTKRM